VIIGTKIAEKALLPLATNMDGFFVSHSVENLEILRDSDVKGFVGDYIPKQTLLDFENPKTFGPVALQNSYFEFRKQIYDAMEKVGDIFYEVADQFEKLSGTKYEKVEGYKIEDAQKVIVAIGSICGTIKDVVDKKRAKGEKVGLLKIRLFRPFPYDEVKKTLTNVKTIIVMDKNLAFGTKQVLATEISQATGKEITSFIYGLGGRDVFEKQIEELFDGKNESGFVM